MFCTKCGAVVSEGTKFCIKCGAPMNNAPVAPAPVAEAVAPVVEEVVAPVVEEVAPVVEEVAAPVVEEAAPVVEEVVAPVVEAVAPVVEEVAPVVEEVAAPVAPEMPVAPAPVMPEVPVAPAPVPPVPPVAPVAPEAVAPAVEAAPAKEEKKKAELSQKPIPVMGYFGLGILYMIPIIGLIFAIIFGFGSKNVNMRKYGKAEFIFHIIGVLLVAGIAVLILVNWDALMEDKLFRILFQILTKNS